MKDNHRHLELQKFVDGLQEEDLVPIYNRIGHRLNMIQKAKELIALNEFYVLDRVFFHHGSEHIEGIVSRINRRTVSVIADDHRRWTVSPQSLKKSPQTTDQGIDSLSLSEKFISPTGQYSSKSKSKSRKKRKKKKR